MFLRWPSQVSLCHSGTGTCLGKFPAAKGGAAVRMRAILVLGGGGMLLGERGLIGEDGRFRRIKGNSQS
jgi:hypothetical protein